jgi:hypothetical protein
MGIQERTHTRIVQTTSRVNSERRPIHVRQNLPRRTHAIASRRAPVSVLNVPNVRPRAGTIAVSN